jgi:hypothetical protein
MSYRENSLMARSKTKRESPLWPINPKFGLEADAENGEWVTRLQGYKVTRLQGYKVTRLQGYKVTRLQGCKVARLQGYKVEKAKTREEAISEIFPTF